MGATGDQVGRVGRSTEVAAPVAEGIAGIRHGVQTDIGADCVTSSRRIERHTSGTVDGNGQGVLRECCKMGGDRQIGVNGEVRRIG